MWSPSWGELWAPGRGGKPRGMCVSVSPFVKWEDAPSALASSPAHPSEGGGLG